MWRPILLSVILILICGEICRADELLVIANSGVAAEGLSSEELTAIYLLKTTTWQGGDSIVPVSREATSSERAMFSDAVMHQTPRALNTYWNQMHFKGKVPPLIQESDQAVLAFVQKVPGAIGYINASVIPKNVKVLARVP